MKLQPILNRTILNLLTGLALVDFALVSAVIASVPDGKPEFSDPLVIDNRFYPFKPGAMKVYTITEGEIIGTVVELFLHETATFAWNGVEVECRVLKTLEFEYGQLTQVARNYFAQADDGTVYFFGELDQLITNETETQNFGWLVRGYRIEEHLLPQQPELSVLPGPTIFMPANPQTGDIFKPEDLFPVMDETDEVIETGVDVRVTGGDFHGAVLIEETTLIDTKTRETKWYAPNVGLVKGVDFDWKETIELIASTMMNVPSGAGITDWDFMLD